MVDAAPLKPDVQTLEAKLATGDAAEPPATPWTSFPGQRREGS